MNPAVPTPSEQTGLTQRAQTLLDLGRREDAVVLLLQVIGRSPGDVRALCLLSLAHGGLGNAEEALRWAGAAIQAAPDYEWGHRLRAIHLLDRALPRPALAAAEQAARLAPETPEVLHTLARVYLRLNRLGDAAQAVDRLRRLAPDSYLTHEIGSLVALRRTRWREAEDCCRRALSLRPNSYYALNNLGVALSRQSSPWTLRGSPSRLPEAINCLYQAVKTNPADPLARKNLTTTLSRFLLAQTLATVCLAALFLSPQVVGLAAAAPAARVLLLVLFTLFVAFVTGLFAVSHRRLRTLPPEMQSWWHRHRWRHLLETRLILRPFLRR